MEKSGVSSLVGTKKIPSSKTVRQYVFFKDIVDGWLGDGIVLEKRKHSAKYKHGESQRRTIKAFALQEV